ncbi:hypothetical protein [Myxococcus sp. Y35]|uniref:hypothetical protein n=1 Tax=Pseudomyxococcus flavus TaxID=3115648 RepID=UPI003CEE76C2
MVATTTVAAPANDQIRVERRGNVLELRWSDAEERLQGTIHPAMPREGEPISVSLHVGNFEGPEFDGPLTLTFHPAGSPEQQTKTLTRDGVNWHTELVPDGPGPWDLEVRYRRTHLKVLTARFVVSSTPIPRGVGWGLVLVGAGAALAFGVRNVLRRVKSSGPGPLAPTTSPHPPAPGTAPEPGEAPAPPADPASRQ